MTPDIIVAPNLLGVLAAAPLPQVLGRGVLAIVTYAILGLLLLVLGYFVLDATTPGNLSTLIRTDRSPNAAMLAASGVAGVSLIVVAAIWTSGGQLVEGLTETLVWGLVGVLAQAGATFVFERVIRMDVKGLLAEQTLSPGAIVVGVTRVAIGLITAFALI